MDATEEYGVVLPDGTCYVCTWSPLGLLLDNIRACPGMMLQTEGVKINGPRLMSRRRSSPSSDVEENAWRVVQWWPHLWWLRFLLGIRGEFIGTPRAPFADWADLDRILSVWMTKTSVSQRNQFFRRPSMASVLELLVDVPSYRRSLRYIWRWATANARHLLEPIVPIPMHKEGMESCCYSLSRSLTVFTHVMHTQMQSVCAYSKTMGDVEAMLLRRYGVPLFETECCNYKQEVLVPYSAHQHFKRDIRHARNILRWMDVHRWMPSVRLYSEMDYAILEYRDVNYLTPREEDSTWRAFTFWVCQLLFGNTSSHFRLVFVDAGVRQRAVYYARLRSHAVCYVGSTDHQITWLQRFCVRQDQCVCLLSDACAVISKKIFSLVVVEGFPSVRLPDLNKLMGTLLRMGSIGCFHESATPCGNRENSRGQPCCVWRVTVRPICTTSRHRDCLCVLYCGSEPPATQVTQAPGMFQSIGDGPSNHGAVVLASRGDWRKG